MENVWLGILLFCIGWHFMYQRKMAESARRYIVNYCEKNQLQFISIAKLKTRLGFSKREGLLWKNDYHFEFSGDGESRYEGTLTMHGVRVYNIDMPVYRVG